jgi:hypothetical protein
VTREEYSQYFACVKVSGTQLVAVAGYRSWYSLQARPT